MKKIGIICLALVVALGGLGIGYAAWTDSVTVTGTVNTGNVDIDVVDYSGTYVWKTPGYDDEDSQGSTIYDVTIESGWMSDIGDPAAILGVIDAFPNNGNGLTDPVACATAVAGAENEVVVTFDNLFPCINFSADFLLHYNGSVPVKVYMENVAITGIDAALATITYKWYESDADGNQGNEIVDILGYQLHKCDYVLVKIVIHVTQTQDSMLQTGSISGTIGVKQWNEVNIP
jgi:predicted ribosomally synthesized peptide with SipW-like signal peptide